MPYFLQKNGVLMNEEVLRIKDPCFRSAWVYEKCLQSLLQLMFSGMGDWSEFASVSSHVSKEMSTCDIGLYQVLKHVAYFVLDQCDLPTKSCLK